MDKKRIDYSVYLVTDSTLAMLGGKDICEVVEAALRGGVTCVQYREKNRDTGELVETARKLHAITKRFKVPLLINDRVDVALAVGCEGVHIGQDDLDLESARKLLGPDKIIGVTVSNSEEAFAACEGGADYLGIGTVYATSTKQNTKSIIGIDGLQRILTDLDSARFDIKTVCIGGINASNAGRVVWDGKKRVGGVAVVSAIMAAADPEAATQELRGLVKTRPGTGPYGEYVLDQAEDVIKAVVEVKPLSHNMTNLVVQNFAANVALCVGASPIMANYGEEAPDLAKHGGALVINMGTVTPEGIENYLKALRAYNAVRGPVIFDPVGGGATTLRRSAARTILSAGQIDVIKGNRSEILACLPGDHVVKQRGVDSAEDDGSGPDTWTALTELSRVQGSIVVMTGKTDYLTDGNHRITIENGHEYQAAVTGTGCCLGTAISAMVAAYPEDRFAATVVAVLHYNIAAEIAAENRDVRGPGTFVPAFLDELYNIRVATARGDTEWLNRARITDVTP